MNRRKWHILGMLAATVSLLATLSWTSSTVGTTAYPQLYNARLTGFRNGTNALLETISRADLATDSGKDAVRAAIRNTRRALKATDFWTRYFEPTAYKKLNGPLPVEWETEVFEKWEKPYRREGAGLTLAWLYLDEEAPEKDSLRALVTAALEATAVYEADSITGRVADGESFYFCNRLYLLNLAAIYTTGFECPDGDAVIPELRAMLESTGDIYTAFNGSHPTLPLSREYLALYDQAIAFAQSQPDDYTEFDHFTFLRDYVNPLFRLNAGLMAQYDVRTKSLVDYALSKTASSIFDKDLYRAQSDKGIFHRVKDPQALAEIERLGKLLFYDPILSGNNARSCASCHKPGQGFTDTVGQAAFHFDHTERLARNTPSLLGAPYNHLVMADGAHLSLQAQNIAVISNIREMNGGTDVAGVLRKVLQCDDYRKGFQKLLSWTPQEPEVTIEHLVSAITYYYTRFSKSRSPFDEAITGGQPLDAAAVRGFNLFMGKAQCATCHFVPQFNGVKPPYIGSEFEVLGTPADTGFHALSADRGRYTVNPAEETDHAFRTGTVRNAGLTAPYMHNGVFRTLEEVIEFYDRGGGAGRGLEVPNQTLSAEPLHLTATEKSQLLAFIRTLDEHVPTDTPPARLPLSRDKTLNRRSVGGVY